MQRDGIFTNFLRRLLASFTPLQLENIDVWWWPVWRMSIRDAVVQKNRYTVVGEFLALFLDLKELSVHIPNTQSVACRVQLLELQREEMLCRKSLCEQCDGGHETLRASETDSMAAAQHLMTAREAEFKNGIASLQVWGREVHEGPSCDRHAARRADVGGLCPKQRKVDRAQRSNTKCLFKHCNQFDMLACVRINFKNTVAVGAHTSLCVVPP